MIASLGFVSCEFLVYVLLQVLADFPQQSMKPSEAIVSASDPRNLMVKESEQSTRDVISKNRSRSDILLNSNSVK